MTRNVRTPLIVGNWKMHKTIVQVRELAQELCAQTFPASVEIVVAPPFTALSTARDAFSDSPIALAAQTMHESDIGPHTGEISPTMLQDLGVAYVILGHSERRQQCNETDAGVNRKVRSALAHGLTPIVAVGDTHQEHLSGETIERVTTQTHFAFDGIPPEDVERCIVAYEPIWAIGTGITDTPAGADEVIGEIRRAVPGLEKARILYGGSMKPDNAAALLAMPNIDGGLVGGASLFADLFSAIVRAAGERIVT